MKEYIKKGSWNQRAFTFINKLIAKHGIDSATYNPNIKPFAVFDWDNTSIIGDVEESLLYYMITNLKFKLKPDELYYVIRKNVSLDDFDKKYNNLKQESVNIDKLSYDIYQAYRRLYATSNRLGGDIGFENISQTNFYKDF